MTFTFLGNGAGASAGQTPSGALTREKGSQDFGVLELIRLSVALFLTDILVKSYWCYVSVLNKFYVYLNYLTWFLFTFESNVDILI